MGMGASGSDSTAGTGILTFYSVFNIKSIKTTQLTGFVSDFLLFPLFSEAADGCSQ